MTRRAQTFDVITAIVANPATGKKRAMAKRKKAKNPQRHPKTKAKIAKGVRASHRKKTRSPAQKAATARMIAALHRKKGTKAHAKKKGPASKRASRARASFKRQGMAVHHDASEQQGRIYAMTHDASGRRLNPHRGKKKHHKKHHARRRRNPSMPERAMHAVGAIVGGTLAAGAIIGGRMALQKMGAKTKSVAVLASAGAAVLGGGAIAALGAPAAGTVVAAGLAGIAIEAALSPSASFTGSGAQLRGIIDAQQHMRGVVEMQGIADVRRLGPRRHEDDLYATAEQRQIRGIVEAMGR